MWSQGPHAETPFSRNRVATKPFIASNAHRIHGCDACEVGGAHGAGKWGVRSVDWVVSHGVSSVGQRHREVHPTTKVPLWT